MPYPHLINCMLSKMLRTTSVDKATHYNRVTEPQPIRRGSRPLKYLREQSSRVSGEYELTTSTFKLTREPPKQKPRVYFTKVRHTCTMTGPHYLNA